MAKSPQEILENHVERARQSVHGLEAALSAGNEDLVALNIDQGFRACLFQGLLRWRIGPGSPVQPFQEAFGFAEIVTLRSLQYAPVGNETGRASVPR